MVEVAGGHPWCRRRGDAVPRAWLCGASPGDAPRRGCIPGPRGALHQVMSDDASAGPATSAMRDSERVLQRVETAVTRIGAVAGAAAATVVLVAVVGGAVMWRFRNAGLPAGPGGRARAARGPDRHRPAAMVLPVGRRRAVGRLRVVAAVAHAGGGSGGGGGRACVSADRGDGVRARRWAPAARRVTALNGAGGDASDGRRPRGLARRDRGDERRGR